MRRVLSSLPSTSVSNRFGHSMDIWTHILFVHTTAHTSTTNICHLYHLLKHIYINIFIQQETSGGTTSAFSANTSPIVVSKDGHISISIQVKPGAKTDAITGSFLFFITFSLKTKEIEIQTNLIFIVSLIDFFLNFKNRYFQCRWCSNKCTSCGRRSEYRHCQVFC